MFVLLAILWKTVKMPINVFLNKYDVTVGVGMF